MRLSKKTEYALRALVTLAENHGRGPIPIRELAGRNRIPKKFLEQILLELKGRGVVASVAGNRGGYLLARSPARVSIGEIVRRFEGPPEASPPARRGGKRGTGREPLSRFRGILRDIGNRTAWRLDSTSLSDIMDAGPRGRSDPGEAELLAGDGI